MRIRDFLTGSLRAILWTVMGVVLFVAGILLMVYSPGVQDTLRRMAIERINSRPGMSVGLDSLRLRFPLQLELSGLTVVQDQDTMIAAGRLKADVAVMPLLTAKVELRQAVLTDGKYRMGNADSLMQLRISAAELRLQPASLRLSPLDIDLDEGYISHATVDLTLRPDTSSTPTPTDTAAEPLKIRLGKLHMSDFTYKMRMLPVIDSLGATIADGVMADGAIDLLGQTVSLRSFTGSGLAAQYIAPDSATIAATPVVPQTESTSAPWTVTIDSISFSGSRGLYTTRGVVPQPGLDFAYIAADSMDLTVTGFYNRATDLRLPIKLHATERCGVTLDATGTFAMDSTTMFFRDFDVTTPLTALKADGLMGVGDLFTDPVLPLSLRASGYVGVPDLKLMFPVFAPYLAGLAPGKPVEVGLDVDGTPSRLNISDLNMALNGCVKLSGSGYLTNLFSTDNFGGDIALHGRIIDVKSLVEPLIDPSMGVRIPPMTLDGHVRMAGASYRGSLDATALNGKIALDADFNGNTEAYDLALNASAFPVDAFMPALGVGKVTAKLDAKGRGFDFFSPKTVLIAHADVASAVYDKTVIRSVKADAVLADGNANVTVESDTNDIDARITASGNLAGDTYDWTLDVDADKIDLYALGFSQNPAWVELSLNGSASITPKTNEIMADITIPELHFSEDVGQFTITDVKAIFHANDSTTSVAVHNRDLTATAAAPCPLDTLTARLSAAMDVAMRQVKERKVDVSELQQALPQFDINVNAGSDNMINDILAESRMSIDHLSLLAANNSTLYLDSRVLGFRSESARLDTLTVDLTQLADKMRIVAKVDNRPGTMDEWAHVELNGLMNTDRLGFRVTQQNISRQTGFDIGAIVALADSTAELRLFPLSPTIGYKKWTVNMDNFIEYNFFTRHIDANLRMKGDDSAVDLYTEHVDSHDKQEDLVLKISDVHIADWISLSPFAPPMSGDLSADLKLNWDGGDNINGQGQVSLSDFYYDKQRVASLVADLDVKTNMSGTIRATADLMVDGRRTMTLAGNLNDSTAMSPFNLDFSVIRFPLATVNPFLPAGVARLSGTLNGAMRISGDSDRPVINGDIDFDSTAVRVIMTGTDYRFSDVKIPVVDNVVTFNDFSISGTNENPLYINGTVDLHSITSPKLDLNLKADNMMVVNSSRPSRGADIYGKAYLGLNATLKGDMRLMDINANLSVLPGTNVTYIMAEATSEIASQQTQGMVKFVNLNDTSAVAAADTISDMAMLLNVNAILNIQSGTTINVDLAANSRDKVQILSQGTLNYTQTPISDGRLTGRLNINSGFARYTLPVVGSEKKFTFDEGSYVAFNGDILNPTINVHATDAVRANVTQQGQNSRLVTFDILLGVTGTLSALDVKFDLETNDDITVANELQSMSPEQRANQAMNLLLYNMYTGPGTKASANLTANPLFSFLESQINNWTANNIKGVELTFGIDQYNQTTNGNTAMTMTYSYQVSKTLFNDRFKIVVGGNYSTDANTEENFSQNLINDISFEYFLNKQQTMLLKLFRHTGYESILEGEVTQTGVGFVYKRKLNRLSQMLPRFMRPHRHRHHHSPNQQRNETK